MDNTIGQPKTVQVPNYSGVNIQIFNPAVNAPGVTPQVQNTNNYATPPVQSYPQNYYTTNYNNPAQNLQATPVEKKKTEKREIVELTDTYIKNLENYLNSQDVKIRSMGAKEVVARLHEDESRKGDPALNALINKMLQDPAQQVKVLAMAALKSGIANGDNLTVQLLQAIQQQKTAYGEDAQDASQILLKMAGNKVQKEFEVKDKPHHEEEKKESK